MGHLLRKMESTVDGDYQTLAASSGDYIREKFFGAIIPFNECPMRHSGGRKMSKSLGNGIDAESVLECGFGGRTGSWKIKGPEGKQVTLQAKKIGSECFRFWKAANVENLC
jgi:valyl-tRNA synthetase